MLTAHPARAMGSNKKDTRDQSPAIQAHAMSVKDVCAELNTNLDDGLHHSEAKSRTERYGKNELDDGPGVQPLKILAHQVANGMILVMRSTLPFVLNSV